MSKRKSTPKTTGDPLVDDRHRVLKDGNTRGLCSEAGHFARGYARWSTCERCGILFDRQAQP